MTAPLHPILAELRGELKRTRTALLAAVACVPAETAGLRSEPEGWSVAEIVEHLLIVENGIGRLLGKLGKQADALGPETSRTSLLASLDCYGLRTPERRMRAPGPISPTGTVPLADGLGGLAETRRKLFELLQRVSGHALGELGAPHPLIGRLTFYEWLLFLAQHEERHTIQIRETAGRLSHHAQSPGH